MTIDASVEVKGLEEAQAKAEQVIMDLQGGPFQDGMRRATLLVTRDAKKLAPVDTGRLRSSITPEVRTRGRSIDGIVGTNVFYAPFRELGTRPHLVSAVHIGRWAERHGFGYGALFVTGKATPFLQPAFEANLGAIVDILGDSVKGIVEK